MIDVAQFVETGVSVVTRVSGLMLFTPFPGGAAVPPRIKAGLTLAITMLLVPRYGSQSVIASGPGVAVWTLGSELAIGALMGFAVTMIFEAAQLAGHYAGLQVGFSLVNIIDPQTQVETPVLATLHQMIVLLIFLQLNVDHWLIRGLAQSFEFLPAGAIFTGQRIFQAVAYSAGGIFVCGVQIAAPILLATMVADVALGFVSKVSPQLQVLYLGFPIKTVLALLVWMGALAYWPSRFERYFTSAVTMGERFLRLAQ